MGKRLWTIGHSTRSLEELVETLRAHGIEVLADVRAYPGSRRYPHFGRESLAAALPAAGLEYRWLGRELGGRRRAQNPSRNRGLRSPGFRNFADYMGSEAFSRAMDSLLAEAARRPTAIMCAELLWWKCHRSLIADYAQLARGWEVRHIQEAGKAPSPHRPKAEATLEGQALVYGSVSALPFPT